MGEEAKIDLADPNPPFTLWGYAKSLYSLWFWVIVGITTLTALTVYILSQLPPFVYVRYVLGSFFVLYLPGYSFTELLYPKKENLTLIERIAFSFGLSLAGVPLVGLVLNYTPWGIKLDPIFASLAAITLAFSAVSLWRKFTAFKHQTKATE